MVDRYIAVYNAAANDYTASWVATRPLRAGTYGVVDSYSPTAMAGVGAGALVLVVDPVDELAIAAQQLAADLNSGEITPPTTGPTILDRLLDLEAAIAAGGGGGGGGVDSAALTAETNARIAGITAEANTRSAAVSQEAATRAAADLLALLRDGSRALTGNLQLGGHQATGAADATTATGLITLQQAQAMLDALVDGAPGTLDTLGAIAAALAADESGSSALTAAIAGKLAIDQNLADLSDPAAARGNLGLGTAATHPATDFDTPAARTDAIATHAAAADPHGDRAYADTRLNVLTAGASPALDTLLEIGNKLATEDDAVAALTAQLATLAIKARQITAGAGLTGGGDLTADRTLAVDWGTGTNQVRHGNDAAYTNARTPTGHHASHSTGGSDAIAPADVGAIPAPAAPADGQLLQWNATLGLWVAVNPTGNSELAYADNTAGAAQSGITTALTDINGCSISIPASARPVYISGGVQFNVTAGGSSTGYAVVEVIEVSNGVDTPIRTYGFATATPGAAAGSGVIPIPSLRVFPSTVRTRTLKLAILTSGATISLQRYSVAASAPAWIAAEAR